MTAVLRAALILVATPASASPRTAELCRDAAAQIAQETGVPEQILLALTLTETGRDTGQGLSPWPWALNLGGPGVWPATQEEALALLQGEIETGRTNIDIGCFQINLGWHGQEFASAEDMFDPLTNARYAADLVAGHFRTTGDWTLAAAAFHSRTPEVAARYLERFVPILTALDDPPGAPAVPTGVDEGPAPVRANDFPLLQAGLAASPGSLVPATSGRRPLFGAP